MVVCTPEVMLPDCIYLPRKEGGRGLIGVGGCVKKESKSLHGYLMNNTEWLLHMALKEKVLTRGKQRGETKELEGKALHGEFARQTSDMAEEESWTWLKNGFSKKGTEGLILAA